MLNSIKQETCIFTSDIPGWTQDTAWGFAQVKFHNQTLCLWQSWQQWDYGNLLSPAHRLWRVFPDVSAQSRDLEALYVGSNVIIIKRNKEGHGEVRSSKAAQGTKGERERHYSSNGEDRKANGQSACERIEPRRNMHTREQAGSCWNTWVYMRSGGGTETHVGRCSHLRSESFRPTAH